MGSRCSNGVLHSICMVCGAVGQLVLMGICEFEGLAHLSVVLHLDLRIFELRFAVVASALNGLDCNGLYDVLSLYGLVSLGSKV